MSIATRRSESRIIGVLLVFGLALRGVIAWRFRVDSDEPQHLHVVWAWTQGLLPYRDVFDNHMPLFHLLTAPALLAIGERPTALLWMRLLMLPQWGAALLVTALIGRRLFTSRVGAWSAVLAGFYPLFFFCSLEYRPDVLWTVLWLWAVLIAIDGPPTTERGFLLGLVLGTAAAVSLKTILMLLAFGIAAGLTLWLVPAEHRPWRRVFSSGVAAAAGVVLPPCLVAALFVSGGAFGPFLYGTVWHNLTPGLDTADKLPVRVIAVALMVLAWRGSRSLVQHAASPEIGLRRAFVLLVVTSYVALLMGVWPLVSRQDHLPTIPLVAILLAAAVMSLPLSHATEQECFLDPDTPNPAHRVLSAAFVSGTLSLRLARPASLAAALHATLDVLTEDDPGCVVHLRSRRVRPRQHLVELPVDRMPARLLVKCEAPHFFFDEAGWREIPLQAPRKRLRSSRRIALAESQRMPSAGRVGRRSVPRGFHAGVTVVAGECVVAKGSVGRCWARSVGTAGDRLVVDRMLPRSHRPRRCDD
jgi:hypothetical protein